MALLRLTAHLYVAVGGLSLLATAAPVDNYFYSLPNTLVSSSRGLPTNSCLDPRLLYNDPDCLYIPVDRHSINSPQSTLVSAYQATLPLSNHPPYRVEPHITISSGWDRDTSPVSLSSATTATIGSSAFSTPKLELDRTLVNQAQPASVDGGPGQEKVVTRVENDEHSPQLVYLRPPNSYPNKLLPPGRQETRDAVDMSVRNVSRRHPGAAGAPPLSANPNVGLDGLDSELTYSPESRKLLGTRRRPKRATRRKESRLSAPPATDRDMSPLVGIGYTGPSQQPGYIPLNSPTPAPISNHEHAVPFWLVPSDTDLPPLAGYTESLHLPEHYPWNVLDPDNWHSGESLPGLDLMPDFSPMTPAEMQDYWTYFHA